MDTIRLAKPEDAELIASMVARCYGTSYTTPEALDRDHLVREMASGQVVWALAFGRDGRHLGQAALLRHTEAGLWECGRAIVEADQRGKGVCNALSDLLVHRVASEVGASFILGHLVTSHRFIQQYSQSRGFVPTGMLLGMAPASLCPRGIARPSQPVSIVIALLRCPVEVRERELFLAEPELSRALDLLARLGVPARAAAPARDPVLPGCVVQPLPSFGIARLRFGASSGERRELRELLADAQVCNPRVCWADVPVEHPGAAALIASLRREGFSWGAYIPLGGVDGEDVLRLQRLGPRMNLRADAIHVLDELKPLRDSVLSEVPAEVVHA